MCGDETISYGELEAHSNRLAHLFRQWGLRPGDGIALLMGNEARFYEFYWAAMRAGLYFTPINTHLTPGEMQYIAADCDAKVFIVSAALGEAAGQFAGMLPRVQHRIVSNGALAGFEPYPQIVAGLPGAPIADEVEGMRMLYSSGTTGRPKGIRVPLSGAEATASALTLAARALFGFRPDDRFLSVGPLYHAAPLVVSSGLHRLGGTRFDAQDALRLIEMQRITISQFVPTHFVRLLQLPAAVRQRYDLSSHRTAIHVAAPCPLHVKQQMIAWWGPILLEYYAGTEGGGTLVTSAEWLKKPGTVGRHWTGGKIWILDDQGNELPHGKVGTIYFEASANTSERFEYYKDAKKTAQTYRNHLYTLSDVGYLDADEYLFLTDRQSYLIISGGVNIYPQEVENVLLTHPAVADAAVIGVPDEVMGEQVKAVIELREGALPGDEVAGAILAYCRANIAHFKCPRSVDFVAELPRSAAGKLMKRELKARYWPNA